MGLKLTSLDILLNILKCLLCFYLAYYGVGSICFASFSQQSFDGRIPFDFENWIDLAECCRGYPAKQLVNLLSMEITYILCGVIYGLFIDEWVWDYAVSVTVVHIGLSCLVMLGFPLNWSWWLCLAVGLLLMISLGEALAFLRRKRNRARLISPEQQPDPFVTGGSFLQKSR